MLARLLACVFVALCAGWPLAALAQVPASEEPGHQGQRFVQAATPKAKPGGTISLPGTVAPVGAGAIVLHVDSIQIVGSTVYPAAAFAPLYAGLVGKEVTLAAIYDLAQKITAKYGNDGYVLSRAVVPPQNLDPKGAVVTIKIVEAYIDTVQWPSSLAGYREFLSKYTARITAERPANIHTIMRYLLLAEDFPGVHVTSQFKASTANPNASTLIVDATAKPVEASAQVDNRGTEARGPWEYLVSATFNDLLGIHEALTATYAAALPASELQYLALNYRQILNNEGLVAFGDASYSWGAPGTDALTALDFQSQSLSLDTGLSFPVIRSREENLTLSGLVFLSNNAAQLLGSPNSDDRLRGVRLKADFDAIDSLNGTDQINAVVSQGFEGLGSSVNGSPLASRENGRVDFTTIAASISRTQPFANGLSALVGGEGQYAFTPLLSPEECSYGGKDIGRGFDPAEITGDSCWSAIGELRFDPNIPNNLLTQAQFYAFADYGHVYRIAPATGTPTENDGASAGVGLRVGTDKVSADVSAAKPLFGRTADGWRYFLTATAKY